MARLLALSGSSRTGSLNQQVVSVLADIAEAKGNQVTAINLGALALPIYNADEEAKGAPAGVDQLRDAMLDCQGFIIGCPEYNGFMTPLLLNALDWASRSAGKPELSVYANKVVLLSSASPGGFGGMRASGHLRTLLSGIGCIVVPQAFSVPAAAAAFDETGTFINPAFTTRAEQVVERFVEIVNRFQ